MYRKILPSLFVTLGCVACSERDLRGSVSPSPDGRTYLAIVDDNGGHCGPMTVDGKIWPHAIGKPGPIEPGRHTISCGSETYGPQISFSIPPRIIFKFDYWGS